MTVIKVTQSCPHPRTGKPQKPFLIPFSYELLNEDGTVALAKVSCVLSEETHTYEIPLEGSFIPVFMHGFGAHRNKVSEDRLDRDCFFSPNGPALR